MLGTDSSARDGPLLFSPPKSYDSEIPSASGLLQLTETIPSLLLAMPMVLRLDVMPAIAEVAVLNAHAATAILYEGFIPLSPDAVVDHFLFALAGLDRKLEPLIASGIE
jgi:hypothetical protein